MAVLFALASAPRLDAQLVVENLSRKWAPGAIVDLSIRGREASAGARIEEVRFDGQPIAFDQLDAGSEGESIRIRIRVPAVARPGSHQISVRFSQETVTATVPAVQGLVLAEARRLLATRGLSADTGDAPAPPDGAFMVVTAQQPRPGARVSTGARVTLEVSSRSEVPELVGLSLADARLELRKRSLELAPTSELAAADQTVRQQDPAAGEIVAAGSEVTVESLVTVPDLIGRDAGEMKAIVRNAGLRSRLVFVDPAGGLQRTVVGQDPEAGRSVPPGSTIAVVFEQLADPLTHRWPWAWMALTAALAAALVQQRVRVRRSVRRSFRVKASKDLDGLRKSATAPAWEGRELKLDVRLRGIADRGRQTLEIEGPLIGGASRS